MQSTLPIKNDCIEIFSNELMDAMCRAGFSAREWNVVMAVIRKTYGCRQKESDISLSQLEKITGIRKTHLSSTVRNLATAGVLIRRPGTLLTHVLAFNQNYHAWNLSDKDKATESVTLQTADPDSLQQEPSIVELHVSLAEKTNPERVPEKVTVSDSDTVTLREEKSKNEEKKRRDFMQ